jgi:hypothetical protein
VSVDILAEKKLRIWQMKTFKDLHKNAQGLKYKGFGV